MCGIAGWIGNLADSPLLAEDLLRLLKHRGPDGHGVRSWPEATLVHTRLRILDLSDSGAQPMPNEDGSVWAVFNGEIYNHRELRAQLEGKGHKLESSSDTAVLTHLYEEYGTCLFSRLRGMFSVAIYDRRDQTLVLGRDRFGVKPLFCALLPDALCFSSEIRALLALPLVDDRPDPQAISDFAALSYVPAPATFYRGIQALLPGQFLEVQLEHGRLSVRKAFFNRWSIQVDSEMDLDTATDRAHNLLVAAVTRQLESDVPLGALLSGGIDSSLVSTIAQGALKGTLQTFNVRFAEEEYDETWAAVNVANQIGSTHRTLDIEEGLGTWEEITALLRHLGQPFADTSLFAASAICRSMRKQVTVALSGDGGDEGFGGYDIYWRIVRIAQLQSLPEIFWRPLLPALRGLSAARLCSAYLPERLREVVGADDASIMHGLFCWIGEEEHKKLCREMGVLPVKRLFEPEWDVDLGRSPSRLERLSALATEVNTRLTLPNDFLFKVDMASMREGLEVRVPMLDEELFSFGLSLPHCLKTKGRVGKRVLRSVAERLLPAPVATKPKHGFAVPVDRWVDQRFREAAREVLLASDSRLSDFFRPEVYRPIVAAFCDGKLLQGRSRAGLYQRFFMLLSLHLMLRRN